MLLSEKEKEYLLNRLRVNCYTPSGTDCICWLGGTNTRGYGSDGISSSIPMGGWIEIKEEVKELKCQSNQSHHI